MQFKSLAMIICLAAGSVLSAPINKSSDHSLERRFMIPLLVFHGYREKERRRKEKEAALREAIAREVFRPGASKLGPSKVSCSAKVTVKSGDSCNSIAAANGINIAKLESLNPGLQCVSSHIYPGQTFCVR
jgi:LysM repeat protein